MAEIEPKLRRISLDDEETVWALPRGADLFQLSNIPLGDRFNCGDVVRAQEREEQLPLVTALVERGPWRKLFFSMTLEAAQKEKLGRLIEALMANGFEKLGGQTVAFNVPRTGYQALMTRLEALQAEGEIADLMGSEDTY